MNIKEILRSNNINIIVILGFLLIAGNNSYCNQINPKKWSSTNRIQLSISNNVSLKYLFVKNERGQRINRVSLGDKVQVFFSIKNASNTQKSVFIRDLRGNHSQKISLGPHNTFQTPVQLIVRKIEFNRKTGLWQPMFSLFEANSNSRNFNRPFSDGVKNDNSVKVNNIRFILAGDLEIKEITNIQVQLYNREPHYPRNILLSVKILNNDEFKASLKKKLKISISGKRMYIPYYVRTNPSFFPQSARHDLGCSGNKCTIDKIVYIPAIQPKGQMKISVSIPIFNYTLWRIPGSKINDAIKDSRNKGYLFRSEFVGGYFTCPSDGRDPIGSIINVNTAIESSGDDKPGNNGMKFDVSLGGSYVTTDGCETSTPSNITRFAPLRF